MSGRRSQERLRGALIAALVAGSAAGCTSNAGAPPQNNLSRPDSMALVCLSRDPFGGFHPQPLSVCNAPPPPCAADAGGTPAFDAGVQDAGPRNPYKPHLYGFAANAGTGTVAVFDATGDQLFNLDPHSPGFSLLPVGPLPSDIKATADGCRVVVANGGACDLAVIDAPATITYETQLVHGALPDAGPSGPVLAREIVGRISPITSHGLLGARPQSIVLAPPPAGTVAECGGVDYHAFVSFPSCHLVADVDLASGRVLDSVFLTPAGLVAGGADPVCPAECSGRERPMGDAGGLADAGVAPGTDGGASATAPPQAGALELSDGGTTLWMGGQDAPYVGVATLDATDSRFTALATKPLAGTAAGGVTVLRETPPLQLGAPARFLYAVARDTTIHVLDLMDDYVECDTNPDPRAFSLYTNPLAPAPIPAHLRACVHIDPGHADDDSAAFPMRATAAGPGISLPGNVLPTDVAFAPVNNCSTAGTPQSLDGVYGFVTGSNGVLYYVNLQDEAALTSGPRPWLALSHQIRDANNPDQPIGGTFTGNAGPPRMVGEALRGSSLVPVYQPGVGPDVAHELVGSSPPAVVSELSGLQSVVNGMTNLQGLADYESHFPDPQVVRSELWFVSWQGVLPGLVRSSATVASLDAGSSTVSDPSALFCTHDTRPGDLLELTGCVQDSDCQSGQFCFVDPSEPLGARGLCLDHDSPQQETATENACRDTAVGGRQFEVLSVKDNVLTIGVHLEVGPTPLAGCATDADCPAPTLTNDVPPGVPVSGTGVAPPQIPKTDICEPSAGPLGYRRCVATCRTSNDCGAGYVCAQTPAGSLCVSAPLPTPTCFPQISSYDVRAGDAFTVVGQVSGYFSRQIRNPDGTCALDPTMSPLLDSRAPRRAPVSPACGASVPAPCILVTTEPISDGRGDLVSTSPPQPELYYANPVLGFHLVQLYDPTTTNFLDQQIPGDFVATLSIAGGFVSASVDLTPSNGSSPAFPAMELLGPDRLLYVVDEGDSGTTVDAPGQILRVQPGQFTVDPSFSIR